MPELDPTRCRPLNPSHEIMEKGWYCCNCKFDGYLTLNPAQRIECHSCGHLKGTYCVKTTHTVKGGWYCCYCYRNGGSAFNATGNRWCLSCANEKCSHCY